jgi:hypothetical protein
MWSRNIQQLLDKLKDTIPGEGMIGEVHYWRDMARILEAINGEVKQAYVEVSVHNTLIHLCNYDLHLLLLTVQTLA